MAIECPDHLQEVGKEKWNWYVKQLGTLPESHVTALSLLCQSWQDYHDSLDHIRNNGLTFESAHNGRIFVNPSVAIKNEAWKQIVKLERLFAVAPDAKGRTDEDGEDAMSAFLGE